MIRIDNSVRLRQPKRGLATIVHISDLHFTLNSDPSKGNLKALSECLSSRFASSADLLICTGDVVDYPSYWNWAQYHRACESAQSFLKDLCKELRIDPLKQLFVIPGNHDYYRAGLRLFSGPSLTRRESFDKFFGAHNKSVFFPQLGTTVFVADTNQGLGDVALASGQLSIDELTRLSGEVSELAHHKKPSTAQAYRQSFKVVAMHHHPMPIPDSERTGLADKIARKFLLMDNASTVLTSLSEWQIDIVLHGHQHYYGVSKVSFPVESNFPREILVVAAGTVQKEDVDTLSLNSIEAYRGGQVIVQRFIKPSKSEGLFRPDRRICLYSDDRVREIACLRRVANSAEYAKGDSYRQEFLITEEGDAWTKFSWENLSSGTDALINRLDAGIRMDDAFVPNPEIDCRNDNNQGVRFEAAAGSAGQEIVFTPPLGKKGLYIRSNPSIIRNFCSTDAHDASHSEDGKPTDQFDFQVGNRVVRRVHVRFRFDEKICLKGCPWIEKVSRLENNDGAIYVEDPQETEYSRARSFWDPKTRTYDIYLEHPPANYRYSIAWDLEERPEHLSNDERTKAELFSERLCSPKNREKVAGALRRSFSDLNARFNLGEGVEFGIMAPNLEGKLIYVAGLEASDNPVHQLQFGWNEGLEGMAWKRRAAIFGSRGLRGWQEYASSHPSGTYESIYCMPVFYPWPDPQRFSKGNQSPRVVAVWRIACKSKSTTLAKWAPTAGEIWDTNPEVEVESWKVQAQFFVRLCEALGIDHQGDTNGTSM